MCDDFLNWANNLVQMAEVISLQREKAPEEVLCARLRVVLMAMFFLGGANGDVFLGCLKFSSHNYVLSHR